MKRSKKLFKKVVAFTVPAVMAAQMAVSVPAVAPITTYAAVATVGFDNSVNGIPDGTYSYPAGENTYVSGGGRHAPDINVKSITVSGGKATATISLTSGTYEFVTVADDLDDLINNNKKDVDAAGNRIAGAHPNADTSEFTIPVKLNENMRFCGWSSSVESWISPYVINISLDATRSEKDIKRIIKYVDESGNEVAPSVEQSAKFYSIITVAGKDEKITEEKVHWEPVEGSDTWPEVKSPEIEGKTPDKAVVEALKPNSKQGDETTVTVTYKDKETEPSGDTGNNGSDNNSGDNSGNGSGENAGDNSGENTGNTGTETKDPDGDPDKNIDNGSYDVEYKDADSKRFNITKIVLHSDNGKYTATITLSGTGYEYLYPGTVAEAEAAGEDKWSHFVEGEDGSYSYTIDVPILNSIFTLASRAARDGVWYDADRDIIIYTKDTDGNELPTHSTEDVTESETKTLTRTVKFLDESGERLASDVVQSITFTRQKTTSGVDGSVTYSSWDKVNEVLPMVEAADIAGMTPDKEFFAGYYFNPDKDTEDVVQSFIYTKSEDNNTSGDNGNAVGNEDNKNGGSTKGDNSGNGDGGSNASQGTGSTGNIAGSASGSGNSRTASGAASTGTVSQTGGAATGAAAQSGVVAAATTASSSGAPATGDKNATGIWAGAFAAAAGGLFAAIFLRRKQRR